MLVYLFELDSEINNEKLVRIGQKALFEEIFINGNSVVISLNQLVDSICIKNLINSPQTNEILIELFRNGLLRINLYGDITSVSQYVQNSINKILENNDKTYIFSSLPVKKTDTNLLEDIKNALCFSDISYLDKHINNNNTKNNDNIKYIKRFITLVLQISLEEKPKIFPDKNMVKNLDFDIIYTKIENQIQSLKFDDNRYSSIEIFIKHWSLIGEIGKSFIEKNGSFSQERSVWFEKISNLQLEDLSKEWCYQIVNLFYNYTIQDSIKDVTYHYDRGNDESFFYDFLNRFEEKYILLRDISNLREIDSDSIIVFENEKLNWVGLNRFLKYETIEENYTSCIYIDELKRMKNRVLKNMIYRTFKNLAFFNLHILMFIIFQLLIGKIELNLIVDSISIPIVKMCIEIIILGLFSTVMSMSFKIPDIFDSIKNILITIVDFINYLYFRICMKSGYSYKGVQK